MMHSRFALTPVALAVSLVVAGCHEPGHSAGSHGTTVVATAEDIGPADGSTPETPAAEDAVTEFAADTEVDPLPAAGTTRVVDATASPHAAAAPDPPGGPADPVADPGETEVARLTPAEAAVEASENLPEAPYEEPRVNDDPEQVMGLDGGALEALLGAPGFKRQEAPAQVWQYRGAACVLDVFLYTDGGTKPYHVEYYEIRGADLDAESERRCFRGFLRTPGEG